MTGHRLRLALYLTFSGQDRLFHGASANKLSGILNQSNIASIGVTGSLHPSILISAAYGNLERTINTFAYTSCWDEAMGLCDSRLTRHYKLLVLGFLDTFDGLTDVYEWAQANGYVFEETIASIHNLEKGESVSYKLLIGRLSS